MHKLTQRYRYPVIILKQLVKTDFKLRYQGSAIGYAWSLLRPLFLFIILYFVFSKFLRIGSAVPHYPVYLFLGIVLWSYFTEVTGGSVGAIVGRGDLLRKINFPKYVLILAGSFSAFINLLINFVVIAIFMIISHVALSWSALLIVPLVAELFVFAIACAFFLSALYVRYRDVSYIWDVILQGAFYATPILYAVSLIPHHYAKILMLSPMAQIIQDARWALITKQSDTLYQVYNGNKWVWLVPLGLTLVIVVLAATYFKRRSRFFAEEV